MASPHSQVRSGSIELQPVDRARRGGRGTRSRRRLLPRPSIRATSCSPRRTSSSRRSGAAHRTHRDRHHRDRHALREPDLHDRGRRSRPTFIAEDHDDLQLGIEPRLDRQVIEMVSATSATRRATAGPTPTWPARAPRSSCRRCRAPGSPSPSPPPCCRNPTQLAASCRTAIARSTRPDLVGRRIERRTSDRAAHPGMNMMSSTLMTKDAGVPFHQLQAEQLRLFQQSVASGRTPARVPGPRSSRSIYALVDDREPRVLRRSGQLSTQAALLVGHDRPKRHLRALVRRPA